jgi:hypothetical protein
MLKRFLAIFALLVAAIFVPTSSPAHAVTYTENYTGWQSRVWARPPRPSRSS